MSFSKSYVATFNLNAYNYSFIKDILIISIGSTGALEIAEIFFNEYFLKFPEKDKELFQMTFKKIETLRESITFTLIDPLAPEPMREGVLVLSTVIRYLHCKIHGKSLS